MQLTENFSYIGRKQNFERDSYATLAEMKAVKAKLMPNIFHATCEETGKLYVYNKKNTDDEVLGKWREVSGTARDSSAKGFFINAGGDSDNLTFDKTPAEVNTAIEQGNIVIVNAGSSKFLLAETKADRVYLFSYLAVADKDRSAQVTAIIATANDNDTWKKIETKSINLKADHEDIYHDGDDLGVDFSDWSEYQSQDNLLFEITHWGSRQVACYVDKDGNEISESLVDQYGNENSEVTSRIDGIAFYRHSDADSYINSDFVENNQGELELSAMHFKDGFNVAIEDDELQGQLNSYQDMLVLGEGLKISEDGTISLKE